MAMRRSNWTDIEVEALTSVIAKRKAVLFGSFFQTLMKTEKGKV